MQTMFISRVACFLLISLSSVCLSVGADRKATIVQDYPIIDVNGTVEHVPVKNVIYMIGDGMGFSHIFTGWTANKGKLNLDRFPVTGMARTWSADNLITDSAAAGTALASGTKTTNGTIGMSPTGEKLNSLAVHAKGMGKSTGVVVTCDLTDATPAAFFAHVPKRKQSFDIAAFLPESGLDYVVGGGKSKFDKRPDGRDLLGEMKAKGYDVALDRAHLEGAKGNKICAILADKHLPVPEKRGNLLEKSVEKGLEVLSRNKNGFFMMVEGSMIDKSAHVMDLDLMLAELFDFDRAVGKVLKWAAAHPGTLVVVTADHHTGGLTLLGGDKAKGEVVCHFSSTNHNEVAVPVFASGAGAKVFTGVYENTDIPRKILEAMKSGAQTKGRQKEACHHHADGKVRLEKVGVAR